MSAFQLALIFLAACLPACLPGSLSLSYACISLAFYCVSFWLTALFTCRCVCGLSSLALRGYSSGGSLIFSVKSRATDIAFGEAEWVADTTDEHTEVATDRRRKAAT